MPDRPDVTKSDAPQVDDVHDLPEVDTAADDESVRGGVRIPGGDGSMAGRLRTGLHAAGGKRKRGGRAPNLGLQSN